MTESTLFVVATPIGNLDDLSPRARQVLDEAELIAAEDTRRTKRLLSHFGIKTPLYALHDYNEAARVSHLLERLADGQTVALVSDAGTPLISDPGFRLVTAAQQQGIRVSPVPGASALLAALSVAGLPTDRFVFEGFLPARPAARRKRLEALTGESRSLVFFEAVHRIGDSVADLARAFGPERRAFLGREMTKLHEQCVAATLGELRERLADGSIATKGEFVLVVEGGSPSDAPTVNVDLELLLRELDALLPGRQAAELAARICGRKRNEMYRLMLSGRDNEEPG